MMMAMVMMVVMMMIEMVMVMNNSLCHPDSCFIIQHANHLVPDLKEKSEINFQSFEIHYFGRV